MKTHFPFAPPAPAVLLALAVPLALALAVPLALALVATKASAARPHGWEPDSTWRLPTVDRAQFLPSLNPPLGVYQTGRHVLHDGSEVFLGAGFNMNRVDGLSPLSLSEIRNRGWQPSFRSYESYGFTSHRWSGAAEVFLHPGAPSLTLGTRWFNETTPWMLPEQATLPEENFLAALFLREDFADYLRRSGGQAYLTWVAGRGRSLQLAWSNEEQDSLDTPHKRLGLFGGRKLFRDNPAIEEGRWHLLRARGVWALGPTGSQWKLQQAHALLAEMQASGGFLGQSREFVRLWTEARGRQRLTPSQFFGYRLSWGWTPRGEALAATDGAGVAGGSDSRLPVQWQFQAGGIGSLRGHRYQEFRGDRIALATLEYGIEPGSELRPVLFLDGGKAWNQADALSGGIGGSGPLALDGGIGLQIGSGPLSARIDVGRDLRKDRAPGRLSLRLGLPY